MRPPRWTIGRIIFGATAGMIMAVFMDVAGTSTTRPKLFLGLAIGAMIGMLIAAYADLDLFRSQGDPPTPKP